MNNDGVVFVCDFTDWQDSVCRLLDKADLLAAIGDQRQVLIKPNLVENFKPPITTPVGLIEAIVNYLQDKDKELKIIIGEGSGSRYYDTFHPFRELGYVDMAERCGVELIDLDLGVRTACGVAPALSHHGFLRCEGLSDTFCYQIPEKLAEYFFEWNESFF